MSDQEAQTENTPKQKLFYVFLNGDNELIISGVDETFANVSAGEVNNIVAMILANAAQSLMSSAEELKNDPEGAEQVVAINSGGLYDDIAFEVSLYAAGENELLINPTIGSLTMASAKQHDCLREIAFALQNLREQVLAGFLQDDNEYPGVAEELAIIPPSNPRA